MRPGKAGEIVAEGANDKRGYWLAPQEFEGISLDGELNQAKEKLFLYARRGTVQGPRFS